MNGQASSARPILRVEHLSKFFPVKAGFGARSAELVRAVDDVSLHINAGETLAVVGESGSGKSTLGRSIVRAIDPTEGHVHLNIGEDEWIDLARLTERQLRRLRRHFHMIFQDPYSSLDPRMMVFDIIAEPLLHNEGLSRAVARERVVEVLELVGLGERHLTHYPHAFSGGQRQRIGIARSLACHPRLIVCDEAVSALDVSVQAQILNLLKDLQGRFGLSYLFIAHDIAVVEFLAHRLSVMYVGRMVELGPTREIIGRPLHPYTEALLSSVPMTDPRRERSRMILKGEIASPIHPPSGCHFHPRCPYAGERCKAEVPAWRELEPGRFVACHFADSMRLKGLADSHSIVHEQDHHDRSQ
jgi:peptide/nickel transport system ATP-binding protein